MDWKKIKRIPLSSLFTIHSGDFHATAELGDGDIPLISCGDTDNGLVGYFDIPPEKRHKNCITVAYNGSPLLSKFHPYEFGAKDDVAVLTPLSPMQPNTLFYIAAVLNNMTWRYNYGRKCFKAKLQSVQVLIPIDDDEKISEGEIKKMFPYQLPSFIPKVATHQMVLGQVDKWHEFLITELFTIKRGDFHSLTALGTGDKITVSRVTSDNGIVGYYEKPDDAEIYSRWNITVSTVGGDAFVQMENFIATDNILICLPKMPIQVTTLFFIAMMLMMTFPPKTRPVIMRVFRSKGKKEDSKWGIRNTLTSRLSTF